MTEYEQMIENYSEMDRLYYSLIASSSAFKGEPQFAGVWMPISEDDIKIVFWEDMVTEIYQKADLGCRHTDKQLKTVLSKQRTALKKLAAIPPFTFNNAHP